MGPPDRLALKFELVTMLRSREPLGARRDELFDLDGEHPRFDVPLKRVKKRRVIQQPLSDLAVEIIKEALVSDDQQYVFESPMYEGQPIHRKAMADALRGTKHEKNKDKTKTAGLCELLGLKPFTPHDLRRTAATLAGDLGFDDAAIAKCLDHAVSRKGDVIVPTVTGKVYNHSGRMKEKRAVLDGVAAELRRIVGASARTFAELAHGLAFCAAADPDPLGVERPGRMIYAGMEPGAVVNFLRALVEQSAAPHDERWQERVSDIPRLVDGAVKRKAEASMTSLRAVAAAPAEPGATLLDDVRAFLCRFISYPSAHAAIAHSLWVVHTHLMSAWESTVPEIDQAGTEALLVGFRSAPISARTGASGTKTRSSPGRTRSMNSIRVGLGAKGDAAKPSPAVMTPMRTKPTGRGRLSSRARDPQPKCQRDFRLRRVRMRLSRLAFAATFLRY